MIKDQIIPMSEGSLKAELNNELMKGEQVNFINPHFNNPDYIKSDEIESCESHGSRIFDKIQDGNVFVHGIDKSCNAMTSILIVLSRCEGMTLVDAIGLCLCDTGLTSRTISDKIRGLKAKGIISKHAKVEFLPPYQRKRFP